MKLRGKKQGAFTIIELLTVMSIIVILLSLLVPALNRVRRYAMDLKQKAQLHGITTALEMFNNEMNGYPPSGALDTRGQNYCGAMKLCEAMLGWDLMGFHPRSVFNRDGTNMAGQPLYTTTNLTARKKPYLDFDGVTAERLENIYSPSTPGFAAFGGGAAGTTNYVLCDVYKQERENAKCGMPILYYKANTSNSFHLFDAAGNEHPPTDPNNDAGNIYNYWDNQRLIALGKPGVTNKKHPMVDYKVFYKLTRNTKVTHFPKPYRADTFILISAGFDGEYGTGDDIYNFDPRN